SGASTEGGGVWIAMGVSPRKQGRERSIQLHDKRGPGQRQGCGQGRPFGSPLQHHAPGGGERLLIVDGDTLMEALTTGQIGGAGLDVLPWDPLPDDHPLWSMETAIITPTSERNV